MPDLTPDFDPESIVDRFYPSASRVRVLLLQHGALVGRKALEILDHAPWLETDRRFVYQAALLHDIGIGQTHSPQLGCRGTLPYVCHGVAGRSMLDSLGLHRHGLVCERHVGVGILARDVVDQRLPLPRRDMLPRSVEERLVCYADKFYSKTDDGRREKTIDEIISDLARYGTVMVDRFLSLHRWFTRPPKPAVPAANDQPLGFKE